MTDISKRVREIIVCELGVTLDKVVDDATLSDLDADSLDVISLTMELEYEFNLEEDTLGDNWVDEDPDVAEIIKQVTEAYKAKSSVIGE